MRDFVLSILLYLAMIAMVFVLMPAPAHSQVFCGANERAIKDELERRYGETVINMGIDKTNRLVLIYVSQKTRTWTIVQVDPMGLTCIIASGKSWENITGKAVGEPT